VEHELRQIVRLAVAEDIGRLQDWTTVALVRESEKAAAYIVTREPGIIAGLPAGPAVLKEMDCEVEFVKLIEDGDRVEPLQRIAEIRGSARDMLTSERIILNLIGRLSGIATITSKYVAELKGTKARIYDTRKTTPGYRLLEKYAVKCGGGTNHRSGLHKAVLIKDNHIAFGQNEQDEDSFGVAESVEKAREFVRRAAPDGEGMIIEIEVDSLEQLERVLPTRPDIVLLDNMTNDELRQAVAMRDANGAGVELEASGGINLTTVGGVARTGVDRISSGALTHSAPNFDVGLDWQTVKNS
ncbi:MAG: carboxylating nicotinate-nucleotide diphosphorylase, partial [Planctomycetota bacterium]